MSFWTAKRMGRALVVAAAAAVAAGPARAVGQTSGDDVLAHAVTLPGVASYAVPVSFRVHVHKPIGVRVHVEGTAFYRAPADAVLEITKAPPIVGGFFKGTYQIDVVPQAWPAHYHVTATAPVTVNGATATELTAETRTPGDVDKVVFDLAGDGGAPIGAKWTYKDGSTITLTFANQKLGGFDVPAKADIAVDLPSYRLEADATYGAYAMNSPIADDVFKPAH